MDTKTGPTKEQNDWLKKLGEFVGAATSLDDSGDPDLLLGVNPDLKGGRAARGADSDLLLGIDPDLKRNAQADGGAGAKLAGAPRTCIITVTNGTKQTLSLLKQEGEFGTQPPASVQPGGKAVFTGISTAGPDGPQCNGSVEWALDSPGKETWRNRWQLGFERGSALMNEIPLGFGGHAECGKEIDKVPVVFDLTGDAPPAPGPEPEFKPPVAEHQPTLRRGDKSKDGWVEYMQELLRDTGAQLKVDGDFGPTTEKALKAFQKAKGLKFDGICGNETWSVLREGPREKVGTDGRKPHTFVDHGQKARWQRSGEHCVLMLSSDEGWLLVNSIGDVPDIDKKKATVRVTPPGGKPKVVEVLIGPPNQRMPDNQGNVHIVKLPNFKKTFKVGDREPTDDEVKQFTIEAYLEQSLGGDFLKTTIVPT